MTRMSNSSDAAASPLPTWRKECNADGERFDAWELMAPGECWFSKVIEADDLVAIVCAETRGGLARRERLIAAAPDLLESLRELREASNAMARVIVAGGLTQALAKELERCQIAHGFGVRTNEVIAKATKGPAPAAEPNSSEHP